MDVTSVKVSEAFGLRSNREAAGYASATPDVPARDENYLFQTALLRGMLTWWGSRRVTGANDGLVLTGHTGCGKSTVAEQFANRLNVPVWAVICSPRTEPEDIFGSVGLAGGNTFFAKGPAVKAAEAGGIFLVEEGDRLDPTVLGMLAPMMEGKPFRVPGDGRLIQPQGLFGVVMTTNTRGGHDETGLYAGNRQQNLATLSRFQALEVGYPSPEEELSLLESKVVSQLPPREQEVTREILEGYVRVANQVRDAFKDPAGGLDTVISTRILLRWAALGIAFRKTEGVDKPDQVALDQALLNNASLDTQTAVHDIVEAVCG